MKRARTISFNNRARKVACTVSAAALMLGVSQAATVGLHFQVNYCYASSYSGFPVTLTAFGIAPVGWENLAPMDTGYGCGASGTGPYALSQVVDTTTSTNGLNPLPNGSLTVTWSASTANFSGFAGYGGSPPGYNYGGEPPTGQTPPIPFPTGEWEVYSSFLRDGVEFGPGSDGCGNNSQVGYSVDIVGLKSLFTNSPFVVELIAASDSMQTITDAFIIDATANVTNSVDYPSTPYPGTDWGDTCGQWFRGHGGGLSTVSSELNTDHVKIIGNRAEHGVGGGYPGFDRVSTISGFVITDKPVVTMSPHQVLVCGGDTVTWSGNVAGVPPLSYQWRKNGVPIPGATTSAYSLAHVTLANVGTYDLWVTNLYGSAVSASVVVGDMIAAPSINNLVSDSNPNGPPHNGLNNGATWVASSTDGASVTRTGVMSFSTNSPSQITVAGETNFDSATGTIMFWMRSSGLANPSGYPATLFDRLSGTGNGSGIVVAQYYSGTILVQVGAGSGGIGAFTSVATPSADNRWHQIALVYDQTGSTATILYVDGQLDTSDDLGAWSWPSPSQELELGLSHNTNTWQAYNGLLDDVRYYNRGLSATEVASAYTGALVDTNALVMQLNFTTAPGSGINLTWQCPDAVLQSAPSVNGPYTDIPGAVSPYSVSVQSAAQFYRYRGHTPIVIVANPYLM